MPTQLTSEAFQRAATFLTTHARPLERALFAYEFQGTSRDDVIHALRPYANEDGGFGRALEPDVRTPSSSALATGIALEILESVGCPADHALVQNAARWLVTACSDALVWRVVPPDTNDHPHAPWWHDEDGSLARTFGDFLLIPRANVVGGLQRLRRLVPAHWLDAITEATVSAVEAAEALGIGGGSDLEYVARMARAPGLPAAHQTRLHACLRAAIPRAVVRDRTKWSSYCVTPLGAVPSPDAIGSDLLTEPLAEHLDFVVAQQTEEGTWDPAWSFDYPAAWRHAHTEWRGILTLKTLQSLRAWGALAPA